MTEIVTKISPRYDKVVKLLNSSGFFSTGVHGTEGGQPEGEEGETVASVAAKAEFGLGQPQRSWLRAWFDENKDEVMAQLNRQLQAAITNGETYEWAMERVALWVQADIQRRIRDGILPENSPITIALKGSSTPLIDSGLFRSSVVSYFNSQRVG